ncbi:hypothetical protein [Methanobrevibacter thaueri]|uniref:Uncharacterized protein n=1 Tax=Methanobrevibacter thaueri TaxID=190975 RepID=A0A315XNW5_9EURY|nr:hypothetical protein [Methanobrevibacter thaueri]PWB88035.1 hypothetical protein MBBTH_01770 [Methanobrevibacter thaueri]
MTLQDELQINIVMSNYNQRSGSYSGNYDYIYLDNLASSSYSNLFRIDLKNLKIKTLDKTECRVLYIPAYGSQPAAILVRIPTGKISQTTKLLLDVYDRSTTFSSTLTTGSEVLMFDANYDTYSQYFMNYSGLSINNDSTDNGRFLRARFVPNIGGGNPSSLYTTFASGNSLRNGRVTVARFKHINGNVAVNDNGTFLDSTIGSYMMQSDFNLTMYQEDIKETSLNLGCKTKSYCMFIGAKTLVMASSFDAYSSGHDDEGNWKQYHIHGRVGTGTSSSSDYIEGFIRNNPTKIYKNEYAEIEISPTWYATTDFEEFNYVDLKWLLIFPSPIFAANGIPEITVTEKQSKNGIRLYKGEHEYPKAYKGSKLLWDANDESMDNTGLYIPDKIINKDWDWVF